MSGEQFDLLNAAKYAVAALPRGVEVTSIEAPAEIEVIRNKLLAAIEAVERVHKPKDEIVGSTGS